jgi:hypothetical protein
MAKEMKTGSKKIVANVWSDAAREAAAEARRAKSGGRGSSTQGKTAGTGTSKDSDEIGPMGPEHYRGFTQGGKAADESDKAAVASGKADKSQSDRAYVNAEYAHRNAAEMHEKAQAEAEKAGHFDRADHHESMAQFHYEEAERYRV